MLQNLKKKYSGEGEVFIPLHLGYIIPNLSVTVLEYS